MSVETERLSTPAPQRPVPKTIALAGVACALGLGLLFGVWAKPDLPRKPAPAPMQPTARTVDIEIAEPAAPPPPRPTGKLEVLPLDMAQQAQALPPPPPLPVQAAAPPRSAVPNPAPARAAFNCAGAASLGERVVCEDPELAAADRRMSRAYRRALDSGAPPDELRDDQRDWLDIREVAARRSPGAVAAIYRQRTAELEELADDPPN